MHEWYEKYASYPRDVTLTTFDKPMLIFLGLTITDFVAGVSSFISLIMLWDSLLSIPVAIANGILVSWLAKIYRERCPPRFLMHYSWSKGLSKIKGFPCFFKPNLTQKIFKP